MISNLIKIISQPAYFTIMLVSASLLLAFAIWLPNLHLLNTPAQAISLLGALQTNFTPLSRLTTITISILSGLNLSLIVYYLQHRLTYQTQLSSSFIGTILGMLGVGCASCGSVIITSILGLSASTSLLSLFPFHGQEFSFLGILILILSIYNLNKQIINPSHCSIRR